MAVAGLLVHAIKENLSDVEHNIEKMPEMTTYGCHQDQYVVVVAEAPSGQLESKVKKIEAIEGVLTIYTTYVTLEDEVGDT